MTTELSKQYDPREAQQRWLQFWEEHGYFHSRPDPNRRPYCIVIPPPNVTGALHMGHALNNTLQDVLIRFHRMQGNNTLWMPGTDHAGIATQAVVERRVREEEGKTRRELGREELIKRIWQWKDQYEARILRQLRELGCSCDWARTRFTLDPVCARAVRTTFFHMFRDCYIFRGKRLVNWDTHLQTSVADDETYDETIKGGFWTFRYPVKDSNETIRFSTTRPETMLGDTAVAVHPNDPRYQHLIGKTVTIPLNGREIPIIADGLLVDPSLGTGCVKVTPAHDHNDYACGQRHKLPMINILNPDGAINENGGRFAGLDRYQAREAVTAEMEKLGFFEGREDRDITLKYSDRSKTPIEPYLSDQWFVKMGDRSDAKPGFAQMAADAVTSGKVKFFPERYAKTYLDWLGEKRDWCISRQLWWGHRIPIWYTRCPEAELKKAFAGRDDVVWRLDEGNDRWLVCGLEDLPADALGPKYPLERDPDVLDTWFSSALWPHSTLGWPGPALPDQPPGDQNPEWQQLKYYYPTSVLVTNRDIITLWVARMVITGLYNTGQIPFHHVYIHPQILDAFGERMSKTKGNGVDPLDLIERYGTDALRFSMVHAATETQDTRLPVSNVCPHCDTLVPVKQEHMYMRTRKLTCPNCKKPFRPGGPWPADDKDLPTARQASEKFEMGRNFANKLWNAARFLLLNLEGYTPGALRLEDLPMEDRWILSRLATTTAAVTGQLESYHFSEAARAIYDFTWSEFCDWYVEMSKGRLRDPGSRALVQRVLAGVLDAVLRLVHPIMPFVAESIWQALAEAAFERGLPNPEPASESVTIAPWPHLPEKWQDAAMEQRFARMQDLVRAIREVRNRYTIDPKTGLEVFVRCSEAVAADFRALTPFITLLAGVSRLECGPATQKPPQATTAVQTEFEAYISHRGLIDVSAEARRWQKQLAEKRKHLQAAEAKLANANFTERAPAEVVQQQRALVADLQKQILIIEETLRELGAG
ncbi:MAG TPA: valine--tRNA ligase [Gemmataceae bacterium]|jgi:valyl-tRNA synthetase|nr:valine--tRNA ligase [Gemmataceae bacterium]